jgi:hypothetical protein
MAPWIRHSPGRTRRLFAAGILCALVAFTCALLLAGREAHAQLPSDVSGGGGTNQLGGAQDLGNAAVAAPAPQPDAGYGQAPPAQAPVQVYEATPVTEAAPVPAATNELAVPVAGTPETVIEPLQQVAGPVAEPVRGVVGAAVVPANGVVEPLVGAAEPAIGSVLGAAEVGARPAVDPAVRPARPGGATPEANGTVEARIGSAAKPDAAPLRGRTTALRDSLARPELAAASPIALDATLSPSAMLAGSEGAVSRFVAVTSSSRLDDLYGVLGRAVFAGERPAVGVASAGGATIPAPQPLPFGGLPAGVGASSVLGAGSGIGGAGLAVLALLLFLLRAGGSLSWLSLEFPRPNSAPVAITERPG